MIINQEINDKKKIHALICGASPDRIVDQMHFVFTSEKPMYAFFFFKFILGLFFNFKFKIAMQMLYNRTI